MIVKLHHVKDLYVFFIFHVAFPPVDGSRWCWYWCPCCRLIIHKLYSTSTLNTSTVITADFCCLLFFCTCKHWDAAFEISKCLHTFLYMLLIEHIYLHVSNTIYDYMYVWPGTDFAQVSDLLLSEMFSDTVDSLVLTYLFQLSGQRALCWLNMTMLSCTKWGFLRKCFSEFGVKRTWMAFTEPWLQPRHIPLGQVNWLIVNQVLLPNISGWPRWSSCSWKGTNPCSQVPEVCGKLF